MTPALPRPDIIIVGAGASGSLLACQLIRQSPAVTVALVGQAGHGRGLAYSARCASHLLNVPAGRMSAFPDDPDHFVRWARTRGFELAGGDFVARSLYGDYLSDLVQQSADRAGERLWLVRDRAVNVTPVADGVEVRLERGGPIRAGRAVLALGNAAPGDPRGLEGLRGTPFYAADPWAPGALDGIDPAADVLLVGTGLTMIDLATELASRGHTGTIHAVSRRGLLPQPHRSLDGPPPVHPAPCTKYWPRTARGLLKAVRMYVRRCAVAGADWREAVTALRPVTAELWSSMPEGERARFIALLQPYWDTHRHRAAPKVAAQIEALRESGGLAVHAARIARVDPPALGGPAENGALVAVTLRPRGAGHERTLRVARVINCTGPRTDLAAIDDACVCNLRDTGTIVPDALRLGIECDAAGRVVDARGTASGRIWAIGPMRRAQLWETTAIPEIRVQARDLAAMLLADVQAAALKPSVHTVSGAAVSPRS